FDYFSHGGRRLLRVATYGRGVYQFDLDQLDVQTAVPWRAATTPETYDIRIRPNPFRAFASIEYRVAGSGPVKLEAFDLLGRKVASLVDGRRSPGIYRVTWRPRLAAGIYFLRMMTNSGVKVQKCVITR
ncbi:MAG: T9SS C-terminal target domain-containing protein, partial [Calditrichaeota bacterium]